MSGNTPVFDVLAEWHPVRDAFVQGTFELAMLAICEDQDLGSAAGDDSDDGDEVVVRPDLRRAQVYGKVFVNACYSTTLRHFASIASL